MYGCLRVRMRGGYRDDVIIISNNLLEESMNYKVFVVESMYITYNT
jgi:hypothetical protein